MTRKQIIGLAVVALVLVVLAAVAGSVLYLMMRGEVAVRRANAPAPSAAAPWVARGSGDTVFDMPTSVRRVKISGYSTGGAQNFAVKINRRLKVNALLGTNSGTEGVNFQGTYAVQGGQVEIFGSNGIRWVFEEVR